MNLSTLTRTTVATLLFALMPTANFAFAAPRQASNELANVEVLIIRHAERDGILDRLTSAGDARAKAYVHYFENLNLDGRPIHLTHLFAEKSVRTRHTLDPLSHDDGLPLDTRFATPDYDKLADDLRTHSYGKEILICWHHSSIPKLITALGGDTQILLPKGKWPQGTYDWIIDLRFHPSGKLSASSQECVHEHLMPGDRQ